MFEPVDVDEKRRQIARRRNPAAVRIHPGDVHLIRIASNLIVVFDLIGRSILERISSNLHFRYAATL